MQTPIEALFKLFPELHVRDIEVLDIGSNPDWKAPAYQPLIDGGLARVTGFEADPDAFQRLEAKISPRERYINAVVGDGQPATFKHCVSAFLSSIYEPNDVVNQHFHWLPENSVVVREEAVQTTKLDDVSELASADLMQMDVQGGELKVLQGAEGLLTKLLVVQAEVLFQPMYVDQPLFSDVDLFMRERGFTLMRFIDIEERTIKPLVRDGDLEKGTSLMFWADAVFIRDFTKWDKLSNEQLIMTAAIMNDVYAAFDLAHLALTTLDQRSSSHFAQRYREVIKSAGLTTLQAA